MQAAGWGTGGRWVNGRQGADQEGESNAGAGSRRQVQEGIKTLTWVLGSSPERRGGGRGGLVCHPCISGT